jgi:hypothetical protein
MRLSALVKAATAGTDLPNVRRVAEQIASVYWQDDGSISYSQNHVQLLRKRVLDQYKSSI